MLLQKNGRQYDIDIAECVITEQAITLDPSYNRRACHHASTELAITQTQSLQS